ncbi:MAG: reductase [Lactobacillus iners]|nr:reductase [Lactobacillus iners]
MLVKYKKDYEKIAMGLLSYLPDLRNLKNLQEEMSLYDDNSDEFFLYLFRDKDSDLIGTVGIQLLEHFVSIRYLSLAPGFRDRKYEQAIMNDLHDEFPKKKLTALPNYSYLFKD